MWPFDQIHKSLYDWWLDKITPPFGTPSVFYTEESPLKDRSLDIKLSKIDHVFFDSVIDEIKKDSLSRLVYITDAPITQDDIESKDHPFYLTFDHALRKFQIDPYRLRRVPVPYLQQAVKNAYRWHFLEGIKSVTFERMLHDLENDQDFFDRDFSVLDNDINAAKVRSYIDDVITRYFLQGSGELLAFGNENQARNVYDSVYQAAYNDVKSFVDEILPRLPANAAAESQQQPQQQAEPVVQEQQQQPASEPTPAPENVAPASQEQKSASSEEPIAAIPSVESVQDEQQITIERTPAPPEQTETSPPASSEKSILPATAEQVQKPEPQVTSSADKNLPAQAKSEGSATDVFLGSQSRTFLGSPWAPLIAIAILAGLGYYMLGRRHQKGEKDSDNIDIAEAES